MRGNPTRKTIQAIKPKQLAVKPENWPNHTFLKSKTLITAA